MLSIIKQRILRVVRRAGYVVVKVGEHQQQAERFSELEKLRTELAEELDRQREETLLASRKLAEADREFRLGRERDARELEAARAETWKLRVLVSELQQQLDRVGQRQGENDPCTRQNPTAATVSRADDAS